MTEISRRKFIQLTVLGGAVTAAGCKTQGHYNPGIYRAEVTGQYGGYDDRARPYVNQPDGLQDGVPQYFATACQMCPAGCGLFVRTIGGRAHKIEGNPDHPVSHGKSCARGQASLQHLYNPDRLRFPALAMRRGAAPQRTDWETALARTLTGLQNARGRVAILADAMTLGRSPSLMNLVQGFATSVGGSVSTYSLLDDAPWRAAAQAVYGRAQIPDHRLDEADVILSFGGDFLEAWPSPVHQSWLFGQFRQGPRRKQGEHGKFIYIGPRMSMTAAKADLWLPCNPGTEGAIAQAIYEVIANRLEGDLIPSASHEAIGLAANFSGLAVAQIESLIDEFSKAGSRAVALGGNGLLNSPDATAAFTAVESLNFKVKSQCVRFGDAAIPAPPLLGARGASGLISQMQSGQIGALLVLGQPNPVFTLPSAAGFAQALSKVPFVAALTSFEDETTAYADVLLPTRTYLEDWGDDLPAVLPAGTKTATLRQPIIDPQYVVEGKGATGLSPADYVNPQPWMDTRSLGDILIDLAKRAGKPLPALDMRDAVRRTWAGIGQADLTASVTDNDTNWVTALAKGGIWEPSHAKPILGRAAASPAIQTPPLAPGAFALHLYPHIFWTDGRHANLGWLQENPDPMTSAIWNTWVEINMQTAHEMGIRTGDIVEIRTVHGAIEVPAVPYPGIHPSVIAMPIGQGHGAYGRNADGRGTNPLAILDPTTDTATGALAYGATQVHIKKVRSARDGYHPEDKTLVLTQDRPGGQEPEDVKDLIHTTAKEWKTAKPVTGAPQAAGSIFNRNTGAHKPSGQ